MKISGKLNELKPADLNCNVFDVYSYKFDTWMCEDIGKTVFLTKEEAEQELKEMECAE